MGAFTQLRLLLWKNFLTQIRSPRFTAFELLVPLLLIGASFGVMISQRKNMEYHTKFNSTNRPFPIMGSAYDLIVNAESQEMFETYTVMNDDYDSDRCQFLQGSYLRGSAYKRTVTIGIDFAYAPKTTATEAIMKIVQNRYTTKILDDYGYNVNYTIVSKATGYADEKHMVDAMIESFSNQCNNSLLAGIVFEDAVANPSSPLNHTLSYKIRLSNTKRNMGYTRDYSPWNTARDFAIQFDSGPTSYYLSGQEYWMEGFITTQHALNIAIKQHFNGLPETPANDPQNSIMLLRTPFPTYSTNVMEIARLVLPIIIIFSFLPCVIFILRSVVIEKENRLKEYMRVMGMSQWVQWIAFFITNFIKLFVYVIVITVLLHFLMDKSDGSVAFVFLFLFAVNVVCFAFAVSTFLQSATAAIKAGVVLWMVLFVWFMIFAALDIQSPASFQLSMVMCLNPHIALFKGVNLMSLYETQGNGLFWSKVFTRAAPDEPLTLGLTFVMLIVDCIMWILIAWYVEAVNPGGEGIPQKPWFFVLPSYWFPQSCGRRSSEYISDDDWDTEEIKAKIEKEPENIRATIEIAGITKVYGGLFDCGKDAGFKAVDKLTLKMFHGQITALLGHNGAGKSTTFSMLTGVTAPTSGTAFINGMDIRDSLPSIRKHLGLCPQYNILFNLLTVWEHLEFFCKLKGAHFDEDDAMKVLDRLRIGDKKDTISSVLSGGQKRKLSLAIALVGGSEVVMLDEPTSGMDPGARHETWTLLQQEKENRTIVLTTHFMDEADVLGDRIAIIAHGKVQCCGSPMFLKEHYGVGYHLIVAYKSKEDDKTSLQTNIEETKKLLKSHVSDVEVQSAAGQEATFLLAAHHRTKFPTLLRKLESSQEALGISSFGVSITTMEEVFLRVGDIADEERNSSDFDTSSTSSETSVNVEMKHGASELNEFRADHRLTGVLLFLTHLRAMITKRALYYSRKWTMFIPQLVVPVVYLALMMFAAKRVRISGEIDPVQIDFRPYTSGDRTSFVLYDPSKSWDGTSLKQLAAASAHAMSDHVQLTETSDITASVFELINDMGSRAFGVQYPVAFSSCRYNECGSYTYSLNKNDTLLAYYDNYGTASSVLAISLADSMRMGKPQEAGQDAFVLSVTNHPLPPSAGDLNKSPVRAEATPYILSIAIIISTSLVVSGFGTFVIREKRNKSKHLQVLSGLRTWMYWTTAFLWDYIMFIMAVACFIGIFYAFSIAELTSRFATVGQFILTMLLFGWTAIPMVYSISFLFQSAPKGYTLTILYNILTGVAGFVIVPVVAASIHLTEEDIAAGIDPHLPQIVANRWSLAFSFFFPVYNISNIIQLIFNNEHCRAVDCSANFVEYSDQVCCAYNDNKVVNIFIDNILGDSSRNGVLIGMLFLAAEGFIYWFLVALIEAGYFGRAIRALICCCRSKEVNEYSSASFEDSDVIEEKERVKTLNESNVEVLVEDLQKWYGGFHAVKGVNFHVGVGECFGLLGVNGAGKTSTFQMLTGENVPSTGEAYIRGCSVVTNLREAGAHIGYCPQFDAVIKEMSGEETLYMYSRIRGVHSRDIPRIVNAVIDSIGIGEYAKKQIKTYSGGNKRRLSLGMALVGLPEVLLLDEPTTGVDPRARRIIWNILSKVREQGTALVLTSHSMDECEALCTKLAIMVDGRFRCHGNTQHLKSRYGAGYTLLVRVRREEEVEEAKKKIFHIFPRATLKEEHMRQLNFDVPRTNAPWSSLFDSVEQVAQELSFEDYSLSQTSLEQIFLNFSRSSASAQHESKWQNKDNGSTDNYGFEKDGQSMKDF